MKMRRAAQIATVFAGIGGGVSLRRFQKRVQYHTDEDERFGIETDDGWWLDAAYYRPRDAPRGAPVVLAHGFGQNRALFDLGRGGSLARAIADQGFRCVAVDLRGRNPRHGDKRPWTFDDMAASDLPAIVAAIRDRLDADTLTWGGVGLGAQLLYAAVLDGRADGITAAISIAAAAGLPSDAIVPGVNAPPRHRSHGRVTLGTGVRRRGPALALARSQHRLEEGLRNTTTDPVTAARYLTHAVSDESTALARQLEGWITSNQMTDVAGSRRWSGELERFRLPILMVGGTADRRAPLHAITATHARLGSPDKTLFVAGRDQGCGSEYGHLDLILGRTAPVDIWPVITHWLDEHR